MPGAVSARPALVGTRRPPGDPSPPRTQGWRRNPRGSVPPRFGSLLHRGLGLPPPAALPSPAPSLRVSAPPPPYLSLGGWVPRGWGPRASPPRGGRDRGPAPQVSRQCTWQLTPPAALCASTRATQRPFVSASGAGGLSVPLAGGLSRAGVRATCGGAGGVGAALNAAAAAREAGRRGAPGTAADGGGGMRLLPLPIVG